MSSKHMFKKQENDLIKRIKDAYSNDLVISVFRYRKEGMEDKIFNNIEKNYEDVFKHHIQYLRGKNARNTLDGFLKGSEERYSSYMNNHDEISELIKTDISLSDDVRNVFGLYYDCIHFSFELLDIVEEIEEIKEFHGDEDIHWYDELFLSKY